MTARFIQTLFLNALALLLLAGSAMAITQIEHVRPSGNGKITIPQYPSNQRYGVTYSCLVVDANRWPGDHWLVGLTGHNNNSLIHHMVLYTLPNGSPGLEAGGAFHGVKDGDIIEDCMGVNSYRSHPPYIMYADQPGNGNLDLLNDLNPDSASANGYKFGVPFGTSQIGAAFYLFQYHAHNDEMIEGIETHLKWSVRTTTDVPEKEGGMILAGVSTPVPGLPDDLFMNIPMNSDGEYTIRATTQPAALSCDVTPEAIPCTSCCPIIPPVRSDNAPYEGRMHRYGLAEVEILTGFLHAHSRQLYLSAEIVGFNGTRRFVDECEGCGHGTGVSAFHVFDTPVTFYAGEGLSVFGVYGNATDEHGEGGHGGMSMTGNVVGGYGSMEEMLLYFGYYAAPTGQSLRPGATLTYGGQCDNVQNEGYPNEQRALARYPWLDAYLCRGNCPFDPTC